MRTCSTPLCIVLLGSFVSFSAGADWNQWRGPNRDGVSPNSPELIDTLPEKGLKAVWVSEEKIPSARNGGWGSPIVTGGKVYIFTHGKQLTNDQPLGKTKYPYLAPEKRTGMTDEEYAEYESNRRDEQEARSKAYRFFETLFCLDAESGKTIWKTQQDSTYTRFPHSGSPIVSGHKLLILGAGRVAKCFQTTTGKELWRTKLPGEFRDQFWQSSIAVADGVACVMCASLFGLDVNNGEIIWQGDSDETRGDHSSPVVWSERGNNYFIVNVRGADTICVEPKSGKELWRVKSEGGKSTPVIKGNLLLTYGSSRKKGLRCFRISPEGAEQLWVFQRSADSGSSPVVVGDSVYVQGERRLACVDLATGDSRWSTTLDIGNPRYTSLVAAADMVIYAFDGVLCFAANSDDYQQLVNAKIDGKGLMAEESAFRKMMGIDELEKTAEGQKQAERLWRNTFDNSGPLPCATPAIVDGRVYFRLKNRIACFDFRQQ